MYKYEKHRHYVFTEKGQEEFIAIRDRAKKLLEDAGAFNFLAVIKGIKRNATSWDTMACVDRLIELGEIVELTDNTVWCQFRVFYDGKKHNF